MMNLRARIQDFHKRKSEIRKAKKELTVPKATVKIPPVEKVRTSLKPGSKKKSK